MLSLRSLWFMSIPVSMTATTVLSLPVVAVHASGASISASKLPPYWPLLYRSYIFGKLGSLGVGAFTAAVSLELGSAYAMAGEASYRSTASATERPWGRSITLTRRWGIFSSTWA